MTTIYIAMINDRHTDPEPYPFSTAEAAIAYAKACAAEYARNPDYIEAQPIDGWLYYASYSTEGDSVWVVAKDLDAEAAEAGQK